MLYSNYTYECLIGVVGLGYAAAAAGAARLYSIGFSATAGCSL